MTFAEGYGIQLPKPGCNEDASIFVTNKHSNWYGTTHGACFMALGITAAQSEIGTGYRPVNMSFNFLRGANLETTLHATTTVHRRGNHLSSVTGKIRHAEKVDCIMVADFCRITEHDKSEEHSPVSDRSQRAPRAIATIYKDYVDEPNLVVDKLILGSAKKEFVAQLHPEGYFSCEMYTNDCFTDPNGFIDVGACCALVDITAGIAAWSIAGNCPTTQLSFYITKPAKPGAILTCEARLKYINGPYINVDGTVWADDETTAFFAATYFATD